MDFAAWKVVSQMTIENCFRHTGLMGGPSETAAADQENQQDVAAGVDEQKLESASERLPLRNLMSIAYLLPWMKRRSQHMQS